MVAPSHGIDPDQVGSDIEISPNLTVAEAPGIGMLNVDLAEHRRRMPAMDAWGHRRRSVACRPLLLVQGGLRPRSRTVDTGRAPLPSARGVPWPPVLLRTPRRRALARALEPAANRSSREMSRRLTTMVAHSVGTRTRFTQMERKAPDAIAPNDYGRHGGRDR